MLPACKYVRTFIIEMKEKQNEKQEEKWREEVEKLEKNGGPN